MEVLTFRENDETHPPREHEFRVFLADEIDVLEGRRGDGIPEFIGEAFETNDLGPLDPLEGGKQVNELADVVLRPRGDAVILRGIFRCPFGHGA